LGIPLPYSGEFEIVIMVDGAIGEMVGSDRVPPERLDASLGDGDGNGFSESEMALVLKCTQ
jgi:hypothetical protein